MPQRDEPILLQVIGTLSINFVYLTINKNYLEKILTNVFGTANCYVKTENQLAFVKPPNYSSLFTNC